MRAIIPSRMNRGSAAAVGFVRLHRVAMTFLLWSGCPEATAAAIKEGTSSAKLAPVVELEEDVYSFEPANNGAGPMWCSGSTCLVRIGDDVFVSGLETLKDCKPLNNCRWTLFRRESHGWKLLRADETG